MFKVYSFFVKKLLNTVIVLKIIINKLIVIQVKIDTE